MKNKEERKRERDKHGQTDRERERHTDEQTRRGRRNQKGRRRNVTRDWEKEEKASSLFFFQNAPSVDIGNADRYPRGSSLAKAD